MLVLKRYLFALTIIVIATILLGSCNTTSDLGCTGYLFGQPIAATGLNKKQCKPICDCKDFNSKIFTEFDIQKLKEWKLSVPYAEITSNPYLLPVPISTSAVCAVVVDTLETKVYHLEQFLDAKSAEDAGAYVTHYDNCGVCSTLEDLAVYASNLDIGADVKKCGIQNLNTPFKDLVECIQSLGFTLPCAQIWAYNVKNTQKYCFEDCIKNQDYNKNNGDLSPCLACDEKISGPIFKAFAGRTRRNTGIASSICRKCEEVQPVYHNYPK